MVEDRAADRGVSDLGRHTRRLVIAANCGGFVTLALDRSAPIFRLALMGADEQSEGLPEDRLGTLGETMVEKLSDGWTIQVTRSGQLLLSPPPSYGDPPEAA